MILKPEHFQILQQSLTKLQAGFRQHPEADSPDISLFQPILDQVAERLHDNFPYQSPFYLGQMLKPPHPMAHLAYTLAMCLNPNNHAHDGGPASSQMERECIQQLGEMVGWKNPLGHLCGGGTIANFEALWVARETTGSRPVLASSQAHYTHQRLSGVLQIPFQSVAVAPDGRMDVSALEQALAETGAGTVVATLGTTGLGAVDPLPEILKLRERFRFRLHLDAAYGGYFRLVKSLSAEARAAYELMHEADSVVIDPHKHGLQPYGCGCVMFRDPQVARLYVHDSPYTYFTSGEGHLGEISLECSRAGAAAVALWATMQRFPLTSEGEFAAGLEKGRQAAQQLADWVCRSEFCELVTEPQLDIVVWRVRAASASSSSRLARQIFQEAAEQDVHLALLTLSSDFLRKFDGIQEWDEEQIVCLRACTMKPEHERWMPEILKRIEKVTHRVCASLET